jgi:hypothetical protein
MARPISAARCLPSGFVAETSQRQFHLCHWAVLITRNDLTIDDIIGVALRARSSPLNREIVLGTLYELNRNGNRNAAKINDSFGTGNFSSEWITFSSEYVGDTTMTDYQVSREGTTLEFSYFI